MQLKEVQSSTIKKVGYDEASKTLTIQFNSGTYEYKNVEKQIYESLMNAESKGKFVATQIKSKYEYSKIKTL